MVAANDAFYRAFAAMDYDRMSACWARTAEDVCVHPGWEVMVGWSTIRESWRTIFSNTGYTRIHLSGLEVRVGGALAYVTCVENLMMVAEQLTSHSTVASTNIYRQIGAEWLMVLHHGSPITHSVQMETDESN